MSDKVLVENEIGKVGVGFDNDKDGKASASIEINYAEGVSELLGKLKGGEITFNGKARMEGTKVVFGIDLDGDGEESIKAMIDIAEAIDEGTQAIVQ